VINSIRLSCPSPGEFLQADYSGNVVQILDSVTSLKDDRMILKYAALLKSDELYYVLLAQKSCTDRRAWSVLANILEFRFTRRLYDFGWAMVQADFENRNALNSLAKLVKCLKIKYPEDYKSSIFAGLNERSGNGAMGTWVRKLPECIHTLLVSEQVDIDTFCRKYSIDPFSPLGRKICELFFISCDKTGFFANRSIFFDFLIDMDFAKKAPIAANYLDELNVRDYFDEVNALMVEENYFNMLPATCREKFKKWQDLKRIEAHFGNSVKFRFWAQYLDMMTKVSHDEMNRFLCMDFGSFVAADAGEVSAEDFLSDEFSLIYAREYFDNEYEHYDLAKQAQDGKSLWRIITGHVADARDMIIKDTKSEVYRIGYEKVGLLYSREIMKVMLNLNNAQSEASLFAAASATNF
jgi:hypothetical protein